MPSPLALPAPAVVTARNNRSPHLGEIEVAAYVDRELAPAERERLEAHLEECVDCRQAVVNVFRMTEAADARLAQTTRTDKLQALRNRPRRLFGAAAVLLAASITVVALQRVNRGEPAPVVRASGGEAEFPAVSSVSPRDGASVEQNALVLRWSAHPLGLFRVVLLDSTGSPIVVEETNDTAFVVPSSVRLQGGATYFWRVDLLADGITASTTASRFIVAR